MNKLVGEITAYIEGRMRRVVRTLHGPEGVLRSVFHGPPLRYLTPVLDRLTTDGALELELEDGQRVRIPVLLPVAELPPGTSNPAVGVSGACDESHLLALRNTPACPRFVTLTAPARHSILSVTQATDAFGLSPDSNGGSASVDDWWADPFVQLLVSAALARNDWRDDAERQQARRLLERAVRAADEADRHDPQRPHGWAALARVFAIVDPAIPFATQWSLACGFPPVADGALDADGQIRVLESLADALVDEGFAPCRERLKRQANEEEQHAVDACLWHLQQGCEVALALTRAAPFYYAPSNGDTLEEGAPAWWRTLTVERLTELLEEEGGTATGALGIQCTNALLPAGRGLPCVVTQEVELAITLPSGTPGPVAATVLREAAGRGNKREWAVHLASAQTLVDDAIPVHRQPIRFSITAPGHKKAAFRVVSLAYWEPGVIVASRSATKLSLPKAAKAGSGVAFECQLTMAGEGRHFLDLHVSEGVILGTQATGQDTATVGAAPLEASIASPALDSGGIWGLEVNASAECHYDVMVHQRTGRIEVLRIYLTSDDVSTEGCGSEFERLIRLNRPQERARAAAEVQVDRQVRVADLQGWALDAQNVDRSFYPLVLAPDCNEAWRRPDWRTVASTVLSRGVFLHDPRPGLEDMAPSEEFVRARVAIAARVRGEDSHGLIEAAELGAWMQDTEFAEHVDAYVRSYLRWLEEQPDVAAWTDLVMVSSLEADGRTLVQEPDAVLVSPLHPLRIGWHALAQRALWDASRANLPCPAGSILDPDAVPDALTLPLRTASGSLKPVVLLATDCSSDYWAVLWNGSRIDRLGARVGLAPFDSELGIQLGGVSSGFSVSQVRRSLEDVATLLAAKPILNTLVTSSAGRSDACNEGLMTWARERFGDRDGEPAGAPLLGTRQLQVFDERRASARPEDASIANLAEDTEGAVKWYRGTPPGARPDLGIIAQLETSNAAAEPVALASPLSIGALLRHRVRTQLRAGAGAFLSESRMGMAGPPSGDVLSDHVMGVAARLENLSETRHGYTFAPSVQAIQELLHAREVEYVAVSSAAVDPACFLGGWLEGAYLWDYELPSYSHRAGDTNGYYLLSRVKRLDCDALRELLARLPGCDALDEAAVQGILFEVARRGIPTVRGLSAGHSGASGDLGLFLAGRLLQDEFRAGDATPPSLLPVLNSDGEVHEVALVIPVDPFRGYLQDLQRALGTGQFLRPDLLVLGIIITDSTVQCRITPVEVKYRNEVMGTGPCREALGQAGSLSNLLSSMRQRAENSGLVIWKLAFQHLLLSVVDFGFRVYSQQAAALQNSANWSRLHEQVTASILADSAGIELDPTGRLLVFDGSTASAPRDIDDDGIKETIVVSANDAASIIRDSPTALYASIRAAVDQWMLFPSGARPAKSLEQTVPVVGMVESVGETALAGEPTPAGETTPASHPDGLRVLVGHSVDGFRAEQKLLRPSMTALNQLNMGVVGDLGTGKTQLVKSLVYQITRGAAANGGVQPRFLIFDYKKDYSAPDFAGAVGAKVIKPYQLPLNLFDTRGAVGQPPWMPRFKFFADVLDKIYKNVGPVQLNNLKQAVKKAYEHALASGQQATIYDVHDQYHALVQGRMDSPLSIIGDMVDMELFAREPGDAAAFDQFLDGVVVLSLDELGQDDRTKNMIVAIMLNMFYEHMLRLPKRPYRGSDPQLRTIDSYLLVDEADNIMRYEFDVLRTVLLQGREFGVGVILASQYLRHFKAGATDYREPLLSWFIHKVPNVTPQELSALGLPEGSAQMAQRIRQLGNHQCLFKTFDVPGMIVQGMPFYKIVSGEGA